MLLARASYPYTWNQRRTSHARASAAPRPQSLTLRNFRICAAVSIPNPAQLWNLRSSLRPGCVRGYSARGKSTALSRKVGNAKRQVPPESTPAESRPVHAFEVAESDVAVGQLFEGFYGPKPPF
jgi:hypothetical protein